MTFGFSSNRTPRLKAQNFGNRILAGLLVWMTMCLWGVGLKAAEPSSHPKGLPAITTIRPGAPHNWLVDARVIDQNIMYHYGFWVLGSVIFIIVIFLIWTASLRHTVERRTTSLKAAIQERENAVHELSVHYENLMRLQHLSSAIDIPFKERIQDLLKLGCEAFNMPLGIISHIDGDIYTIKYIQGPDSAPPPNSTFELGRTYCIHTLNSTEPTAFENVAQSTIATHPCYKDFGLESYIGLQLVIGGVLYGTLNFSSSKPHPGPFAKAEFSLIQLYADWVCKEIERQISTKALITAKADAEKANRAKSEFLASMSHELRTPMNAVLGFSQLLQFDPNHPLSEAQNEYVENILDGGNHLLELINDVLDLARIEADQIVLFLESVEASKVVQNCISMIMPLANKKNISIINKLTNDAEIEVRTDKRRFKQILFNLLSNAVKYNNDGGTVTIDGYVTEHGFFHINVHDNGIGIAKENHGRVFQMFQRAAIDPMIAQPEGTGIGLTVTKLLVERLAGQIGFKSVEGDGSTFWIEIPVITNEFALIWTEALRIGIDAIDKDHQTLIVLINKMCSLNINDAEIDEVLVSLVDYTVHHFAREEALMMACDYPDFKAHQKIHKDLIKEVGHLMKQWESDHNTENLNNLCTFLRNWLFHHILEIDQKIALYTQGRSQQIDIALDHLK